MIQDYTLESMTPEWPVPTLISNKGCISAHVFKKCSYILKFYLILINTYNYSTKIIIYIM